MAKSVNVAIIGCGQMGMHHAKAFKRIPGVNLVAICEIENKRRTQAANELACRGYADINELLEAHPEIDGVSIAMPDNMHSEAVRLATKYKKHILLEKPLADNLDDGKAILDLATGYDKVFTVGHLLRYDPRFYGLKEALDEDKLGDVIHISCRRNSPIIGPRRYVGQSDLCMHVMIHDIDFVNWFLNCRATKVFAKARSVRLKEHGMNDVIYAIVTYENSAIACFEASWVLPENSPTVIDDQVQVVGTKGVAYIDSCDRGLRFTCESKGSNYPDTRHWPYVDGSPSGALFAEVSNFVGSILNETKTLCSVEDAFKALQVAQAIECSISEGKEVAVEAI